MPILYGQYNNKPGKQLNQLIFAGSHDAGITGGRHNVRTQHAGIRLQANAGVRLFDVRIAETPVGLATYHGNAKLNPSDKDMRGAYGVELFGLLREAREFVKEEGASEFLILKFDKCKNYRSIAQACMGILGSAHFKGGGSLNKKTLTALAGHVVTVFTAEGLAEIGGTLGPTDGILGCKSLSEDEAHDDNYSGLQYFGKGGTDVWKVYSQNMKINENRRKQKGLMRQGMNTTDRDVMGMMYWTSTGIFESIKERNDKMWAKKASSSKSVQSVWMQLLVEAIALRTGAVNGAEYAAGGTLKVFMPNIVMIDFADETKGRIIADFNTIASTKLVEAFQRDYQDHHLQVV